MVRMYRPTKHKAKKLSNGAYEYRGWKIEEMGRFDGSYTRWNITPPNENSATDTANTLADAKAMVDNWS